jgi:hypothetical protein
MKYQKPYNFDGEAISYHIHFDKMTEAEATALVKANEVFHQLVGRTMRRKCDTEGHRIVDAGSHAGPEGAADHFACARCGHCFDHIYF